MKGLIKVKLKYDPKGFFHPRRLFNYYEDPHIYFEPDLKTFYCRECVRPDLLAYTPQRSIYPEYMKITNFTENLFIKLPNNVLTNIVYNGRILKEEAKYVYVFNEKYRRMY